uniref:Uncharacterized protein n=1 Tax=Oryza sativa subsp. japonica TaxID=39947 RepID=Q67V57_ORYSJ|nr:hypothetical protein [Oryza sativa Japonica Group]
MAPTSIATSLGRPAPRAQRHSPGARHAPISNAALASPARVDTLPAPGAPDLVAVLRSKPPRPVRSNSSSTTASSTRPHRCGPASEKGEELKPVPYLSAPPNWGRKSLVGGREKGWCAAVGEDEEGWGRERGGGGLHAASLGRREIRGVV